MKLIIDVDENLVCKGFEHPFTEEEKNILIRAIGNGKSYEEKPKGEWTNKHFEHADCSVCGITNDYHGDFCKYCGADMRGKAKNEST